MIFYKYLRWLSLDIVLGAIFFLAYLDQFYALYLSIDVYLCLAAAVWCIYLIDHLIDSQKRESFNSKRHQFYRDKFSLLLFLAIFLSVIGAILVFRLPSDLIVNGIWLTAMSACYLLLVLIFPSFWIKELLIAIGYSVGLFVTPFSLIQEIHFLDIIFFLSLLSVAFSNLLIFSIYDHVSDTKDDFPSIVRKIGVSWSYKMMYLVLSISFILSLVMIYLARSPGVMMLSMNFILVIIMMAPHFFMKYDRFRIVGDAIFYIPLIFLLIG